VLRKKITFSEENILSQELQNHGISDISLVIFIRRNYSPCVDDIGVTERILIVLRLTTRATLLGQD
jgi:hypothetical protein